MNRRDQVDAPFISTTGEEVYELIGKDEALGGAIQHSFAYVVIPPNCSSRRHYHEESEETYYILKGQGRLHINAETRFVNPGDTIFIPPRSQHQIFAEGHDALEFVTVCAPAWSPEDNVFQDIREE